MVTICLSTCLLNNGTRPINYCGLNLAKGPPSGQDGRGGGDMDPKGESLDKISDRRSKCKSCQLNTALIDPGIQDPYKLQGPSTTKHYFVNQTLSRSNVQALALITNITGAKPLTYLHCSTNCDSKKFYSAGSCSL